jgi:hypothetical protein
MAQAGVYPDLPGALYQVDRVIDCSAADIYQSTWEVDRSLLGFCDRAVLGEQLATVVVRETVTQPLSNDGKDSLGGWVRLYCPPRYVLCFRRRVICLISQKPRRITDRNEKMRGVEYWQKRGEEGYR